MQLTEKGLIINIDEKTQYYTEVELKNLIQRGYQLIQWEKDLKEWVEAQENFYNPEINYTDYEGNKEEPNNANNKLTFEEYSGKCFCANYERDNCEQETKLDNSPSHYDNSKGSLYKFCEEKELNSWEFDIIKRIMRCRKKGQFKEDLEKTKFLIDLYLKEFNETATK